jgi:transcriptional regulator with XRE-family HTH domain
VDFEYPLPPAQIVAYNLARARELRGWTQEQAAEALAPYLGVRWSKAVYSAAERAVTGTRPRHFDPDDLLAFARGFRLPISWFFLPPDAREPLLSTPDDPDGMPPTLMLDYLYRPDPAEQARVSELCQQLGPESTPYQEEVARRTLRYLAELVRSTIGEQATVTPQALRSLADALERAGVEGPDVVANELVAKAGSKKPDTEH